MVYASCHVLQCQMSNDRILSRSLVLYPVIIRLIASSFRLTPLQFASVFHCVRSQSTGSNTIQFDRISRSRHNCIVCSCSVTVSVMCLHSTNNTSDSNERTTEPRSLHHNVVGTFPGDRRVDNAAPRPRLQ